MGVKSVVGSRRNILTVIIFLVAFVLCGVAWMRFFAAVIANPSPVRYVEFMTAEGVRSPFRQDCAGPAFIENDAVWRFCSYDSTSAFVTRVEAAAPGWGLVRFDLAAGKAEMLWPLPEAPDAQILALGQSPTGDLAVAWGSPGLDAIYLVLREGGTLPLGVPADTLRDLTGLAWTGETLEIVSGDESGVTVYVNEAGRWGTTRAVTPPPDCTDEANTCTLQLAHRTPDGWRMVYSIAPRAIGAVDEAEVAIVAALEDGTPEPVDTLELGDLSPDQYTLDADGSLTAVGALFDQAPGNVVNWSIRAAPFMLHGGTWERVVAPQVDARFYFSDYAISEAGGLQWIPGTHHPQRSWQVDQWVTLRSSGEDIFLAEIDGESGPTLTQTQNVAWRSNADITLLPATSGGYWVLGPNGAYMKASTDLERADALTVAERVERIVANFNELDDVSNSFYREKRALKLAALPLVLLSLPAGYLVVFAVRQARQNRQAWVWLLLEISAVYVIVATAFFVWFWEIMDHF